MNASHIITQATHYKTRFVMNRVVFIWAIMNLPKCQILKLLALNDHLCSLSDAAKRAGMTSKEFKEKAKEFLD